MNQIEVLLSKKLKTSDHTLDLLGSDRRVLQVASQDLTNYLRYLSFSYQDTSNRQVDKILKQDPKGVDEFLTAWTSIWLKKWKQRFRLAIGQTNDKESVQNQEGNSKANVFWSKLDCREELLDLVMFALIRNSEICGSRIIAEDIVKQETWKIPDLEPNNAQKMLTILNNALNKAKEIHQRSGPLVLIKVGKAYYG